MSIDQPCTDAVGKLQSVQYDVINICAALYLPTLADRPVTKYDSVVVDTFPGTLSAKLSPTVQQHSATAQLDVARYLVGVKISSAVFPKLVLFICTSS